MLLLTSLWLGILTSISPCPLASNIAAVSFLSKDLKSPYYVFLKGLTYTIGRTFFYVALGLIISNTMENLPLISDFLQNKMMMFVAPIMVLIGLIMLKVIKFNLPTFKLSNNKTSKLAEKGFIGSFLLGFIFASALCAVSAALFFSNLINSEGSIPAMFMYGIGTGIPVMIFAFILAFSANKIGQVYKATTIVEKYARTITAYIFIIIGTYYIWRMI